MCGRYTQTSALEELAQRFGIAVEDEELEELTPRYNTAPSLSCAACAASLNHSRVPHV